MLLISQAILISQTQMLVEIITEKNRASFMKDTLSSLGFPYIWDNQFDIDIQYNTIKQS
jgi:hypothetical protein